MYYKELFIYVSASTAVSFFSSVIGTGKYSAQIPLHLSDSHESAVKSKYKSPFYKLWQYATKNKPFSYNDGVVYHKDKSYPQVQRIFISCKRSLKFFLQLKNYIKQANLIASKRSLFFRSCVFVRHSDNVCWHNLLYFMPHIDLISWIFVYIRNLIRKEKSNNYREYFKLNNLVLQIYKIKKQRQKAPNKIGVYINKSLHNKVYC